MARFKKIAVRKVPKSVKRCITHSLGGMRNGWRHIAHVEGDRKMHFLFMYGVNKSHVWYVAEVDAFQQPVRTCHSYLRLVA